MLIKLGLFLVLMTGAWLFDRYHEGNRTVTEESVPSGTKRSGEFFSVFCTPQSLVVVKAPVQKAGSDKSYREKFNRMIREQLFARSVYLQKAEVFRQPNSYLALRNLTAFRYHFLCHPDDQPPVS